MNFGILILALATSQVEVGRRGRIIVSGGSSAVGTDGSVSTSLTFNDASGGTRTLGAQSAGTGGYDGTSITIQSGTGGSTSMPAADYNGGVTSVLGGTGGGTTGVGGALTLKSGNGASSGNAGAVTLDSGTGSTTGAITIGGTNAASIAIGRTGITTSTNGTFNPLGTFTTSGNANFGAGITSVTGDITFAAGNARTLTISTPGAGVAPDTLTVLAPTGPSGQNGAGLYLTGGAGGASANGGLLQIQSGSAGGQVGTAPGNLVIDTGSGGTVLPTITFGTGFAGGITIGRSGQTVTVNSTLTPSGGLSAIGGNISMTASAGNTRTISVAATSSGNGTNLTISPGNGSGANTPGDLTLNSATNGNGSASGNITIDVASGTSPGTITIGNTNSTGMTLGRVGQTHQFYGTVNIGALQIGGSTTIGNSYRTATTVDVASIAANSCNEDVIFLSGAVTGSECIVGLPTSPAAGVVFTCYVSSSSNVTLRSCNVTISAVDPASASYAVRTFGT